MPKYAIVAVVEAPYAEQAWESVGGRLLIRDGHNSVFYVGAPWLVPDNPNGEPVEYGTDVIRLRVNGEGVTLSPAD